MHVTGPLFPEASCALAARFLTRALFDRLAMRKTATGFTLPLAIQSGQKNHDSSIGIYAGDAESYTLFREIFDPVITSYHQITGPVRHTGELALLDTADLDPDGDFIVSSRVRVARNLAAHAFPPHISRQDRQCVEKQILDALKLLPAPLKGCYHPMGELEPEQIPRECLAGRAFPPGDRFQEAAGIIRDFPLSRGIYTSEDKKFMVWINEEDHLRIICMERSGHLVRVFNRLATALEMLGQYLVFAAHPDLGYLNACPTNIGTAMRAGVHIRLPKLEKQPEMMKKLARDHGLQIRGTAGEKTQVTGSVFDISNFRRLGVSETRIIQDLSFGIAALIKKEKKL
ncbi:MAG TPA: phosphagen kinase [Desulfotignum sp.]|nr:phosphagen kinase [Desulfotignum sp.]